MHSNVVSDVRVMDPDFQDVMAHEAFATYERELASHYSLAVTYRINRARDLPVTFVTNLVPAGTMADGSPPAGRIRRLATSSSPPRRPPVSSSWQVDSVSERVFPGVRLLTVLPERP
jgi:hypothetical protein